MALVLKDRVKETSSTAGAGTIDLDGAVTGFEGFVSAVGNGNVCYYAIQDGDGIAWEVGVGTITDAAPDTLARNTILASSNSDNVVTLSAGTHTVFLTYPAEKSVYRNLNDQTVITASGVIFSDSTVQITAASGNVVGPGSAINNSVTRYNGTSGRLLQSSNVLIDDNDNVTIPGTRNFGTNNSVSGILSTVGGDNNHNSGDYSFLGCGRFCSIADGADYSFIGNGNGNHIYSNGDENAIGGGLSNRIIGTAQQAGIFGGNSNTINGIGVFIGGGFSNEDIAGNYGAIGGGYNNSVASHAFVGCGLDNSNSGSYSFIGAGQNCSIIAGSDHSVLNGGNTNSIFSTGDENVIGGGTLNIITPQLVEEILIRFLLHTPL
jgi:hypothetical protein